ncbi:MAG: class II aldolase/adducin family protein [Planctomycetes bacterium]|nr:class II aldolase/adducin family protein [Planctomycetota bacterium]
MSEVLLRQNICQAARELWTRGLLLADDGLLSVEVHRRRFLVTPAGLRRSDLRDADLAVVDIGGMDLVGGPAISADAWRPHRIAYRVGLDRAAANGRPAEAITPFGATIHATPPNLAALVRLSPDADTLALAGVAPVKIITDEDEAALHAAFEHSPAVALRGNGSLVVAAPGIWQAVNLVERIEHAASIDLICRRHK